MFDHSSVCWILNAPLTEDGVFGQIRRFRKKGFTSVLPAPIANDTAGKPNSAFSGSGMRCDYLSDEFFAQYVHIVNACRECGMKVWIWDDDFCPSGRAGGAIVRAKPDLRTKVVHRVPAGKALPDGTIELLLEKGEYRYVFAYGKPDTTLSDTFGAEAARLFIEMNYEAYRRWFSDAFGNVISGMFCDEPGFAGCLGGRFLNRDGWTPMPLPWTNDVLDIWRDRHTTDLLDFLPKLFADSDDSLEAREIRVHFGVLMHDLWVERWMKPLRQWCRENDLLFTGHMRNDDYVEASAYTAGNVPNSLSCFDFPAVDVVTYQILPNKENQPDDGRSPWDVTAFNGDFARLASSAAREKPLGRAACELGDAYGWGCDMELRKWLLDYHLARGIDFIHWGSVQYSMRGQDVMAINHFGPGQPYWSFWCDLNKYSGYMLDLLCRGKRCSETAIFYPAEGYMMGAGVQLNEKMDALATFLMGNGVDFDYVEMKSDPTVAYSRIIVPGGTPISECERSWLCDKAKICEVLVPDDVSISGAVQYHYSGQKYCQQRFLTYAGETYRDLLSGLKPDVSFTQYCQISFHRRQVGPGEHLLFLFNESPNQESSLTLVSDGLAVWFVYDQEADAFVKISENELQIPPGESRLLFQGMEATITEQLERQVIDSPPPAQNYIELEPFAGEFVSAVKHYWDGETIAQTPLTEAELRTCGKDFSGCVVHRYSVTLQGLSGDMDMAIPRLHDAATVTVNGEEVGDIIWPPKRLRIREKLLRTGKNTIEIAFYNTLANHTHGKEFEARLKRLGIRKNCYFQITEVADKRVAKRYSDQLPIYTTSRTGDIL